MILLILLLLIASQWTRQEWYPLLDRLASLSPGSATSRPAESGHTFCTHGWSEEYLLLVQGLSEAAFVTCLTFLPKNVPSWLESFQNLVFQDRLGSPWVNCVYNCQLPEVYMDEGKSVKTLKSRVNSLACFYPWTYF